MTPRFLHHANIDRLWSQWQERYGNDSYPREGHHIDQEKLIQFGMVTAAATFNLAQHSGVTYHWRQSRRALCTDIYAKIIATKQDPTGAMPTIR